MRQRRGFSLAEVLVVCSIAVLLLTSALVAPRRQRTQAGSYGLAEGVSGFLTQAREKALRSKTPVGVGIPTAGASLLNAGGLYLFEGNTLPSIRSAWDFRKESPESTLFAGAWVSTGLSWPDQLDQMSNSGFRCSSWTPPIATDHYLVFTPGGGALSDLPLFGGGYHLVTCEGLDASTTSISGHSVAWLNSVHSPNTIVVTQAGQIRVERGLSPADPARISTRALSFASSAAPPTLSSNPNSDPTLVGAVKVGPRVYPGTLPPGVDAKVKQEGHLSLEVRATDAEDDALRCHWTADGGRFSHTSGSQMQWDPEQQNWVSRWDWFPPANSQGQLFHFQCQVEDGKGGAITTTLGATGVVQVVNQVRVAYVVNGYPAYIAVGAEDGSSPKLLNPDDTSYRPFYPRWSPDGSKLLFLAWDGYPGLELFVTDADGGHYQKLLRDNSATIGDIVGVTWTADGTRISFTTYSALRNTLEVYLVRPSDYDPLVNPSPPSPTLLVSIPWTGTLTPPQLDAYGGGSRQVEPSWVPSADRRLMMCLPTDFSGTWKWGLAEILPDSTPQVRRLNIEADGLGMNLQGSKLCFGQGTSALGGFLKTADYSVPGPGVTGVVSNLNTVMQMGPGHTPNVPCFSPNNQWIYYDSWGWLYRIRPDGTGENYFVLNGIEHQANVTQ